LTHFLYGTVAPVAAQVVIMAQNALTTAEELGEKIKLQK
jgi:hypothetical protein